MGTVYFGIALKGTAVLAVAWLAALALRRRSAASRHLVWIACAAALVALPVLSVAAVSLKKTAGALANLTPSITFRVNSSGGPVAASAAAAAPGRSAAATPAGKLPAPLRDPGTALLWLWAAGSAVVFAHLLLAYARMWRTRRKAPRYPAPDFCRQMARALGIRQRVDVWELPAGSMPLAFGVWRPALFLPADAEEWSAERRRVVVLHELAHVLRGDAAAHLLARAAVALFWWNPLAWSAWRQLLKEGERAADDLVLAAGEPAPEYAGHLLEVARMLQYKSGNTGAAVAMARRAELEGRLLAILDSRVNRRAPGRGWAWVAAIAAMALVAPVAAMRAQETKLAVIPPEVDAAIQTANTQKDPGILDQAAQAYEKQRKYEAAQKLLESALAIRGERSGQQSAAYQAGLLKLGALAVKRNQGKDATDFYTRAVAIGDAPAIAPALIYLAMRPALNKDETTKAQDLLQHAINVDPSGPSAGRATTWLGHLAETQGLAGLAESDYLRAMALNPPGSAEAAFTMDLYANLLTQQSRTGEAEAMKARATAIHSARILQLTADSTKLTMESAKRNDATAPQRVGNGVAAPVLLAKQEPDYSEDARLLKAQGTVVLKVAIGTDGQAHDITVVRSLGYGLDEKAVEAVLQWQFKPGMKNGMPVTVVAQIEVNFRLL